MILYGARQYNTTQYTLQYNTHYNTQCAFQHNPIQKDTITLQYNTILRPQTKRLQYNTAPAYNTMRGAIVTSIDTQDWRQLTGRATSLRCSSSLLRVSSPQTNHQCHLIQKTGTSASASGNSRCNTGGPQLRISSADTEGNDIDFLGI